MALLGLAVETRGLIQSDGLSNQMAYPIRWLIQSEGLSNQSDETEPLSMALLGHVHVTGPCAMKLAQRFSPFWFLSAHTFSPGVCRRSFYNQKVVVLFSSLGFQLGLN